MVLDLERGVNLVMDYWIKSLKCSNSHETNEGTLANTSSGEKRPMIDLTTQLIPLMRKEPIVSTFDSSAIISHPEEVITSYDQHATTYVELDLFRAIEHRFIDKIVKSQTPKVCLVARYWYGKTTAAIRLWQR